MTVYIVVGDNLEGEWIEGVFAARWRADDVCKSMNIEYSGSAKFAVEEHEVL